MREDAIYLFIFFLHTIRVILIRFHIRKNYIRKIRKTRDWRIRLDTWICINNFDVTWRTTLLGSSGNASISEDFCSVTEITGWNRVKTISRDRGRNGRAKTMKMTMDGENRPPNRALCNCLGDGNRERRIKLSRIAPLIPDHGWNTSRLDA